MRPSGLQELPSQAERGILALLKPLGVSTQAGSHPKAVLQWEGVGFPAVPTQTAVGYGQCLAIAELGCCLHRALSLGSLQHLVILMLMEQQTGIIGSSSGALVLLY